MWLISGPFDCTQAEDETRKTKLLKTNREYGVGRTAASPLCINSKRVSRNNGQFIVGEHSVDDVSHGALVPTLSFQNTKTTAMKISRGENKLTVNPNSALELESGDVVFLTNTISVTVTWEPVVCFHAQDDLPAAVDLTACASLGIKVVAKHSRDVTHHLTPSLTAPLTSAMLYTLLTPARFVTPEWVVDFIRLGSDSDQGLEKTYNPPIESGFRPEIDNELAERYPMMTKQAWTPNDYRKALFEDMRFVFVVMGFGAGTESKAMADVVSRGGAARQLVNIEKEAAEQAKGSSGTWGTVLKKRKLVIKQKMRSGLVLIGEEDTMTARGTPKEIRGAWATMVDSAKSVNMRIIHPSLIAEAILKADVSVLDCVFDDTSKSQGASASEPLPDEVPSTHPEEPSQLPALATQTRQASVEAPQTSGDRPLRRLTRRATSQTPALEPAPAEMPMDVEEEPAAPPPPRTLLRRRAKTANAGRIVNELLGIDESTVILEAAPLEASQAESQSQAQGRDIAQPMSLQEVVSPTPARPGRLKRRAGTAAIASQLFPELPTPQMDEEPPLKKFKALFEQSGQGGTHYSDGVSGSQLKDVQEEEESSQNQTQEGRKRMADAIEERADADVELADAEGSTTRKRRTIEGVDAVEPSQQTEPLFPRKPNSVAVKPLTTDGKHKPERAKGAAPGKPDTDPAFLRAIASTKRGKKTEDAFDREFNKLRIARPDINNVGDASHDRDKPWRKEWDSLDDFEKDVGMRGNFMQIVEMDVWRDKQEPGQPGRNIRREDGLGARVDWDGREDFKKFRRKINVQPRAPVPLIPNQSQESAAGPSYWDNRGDKKPRGFDEMSQSQENSQPTTMRTQNKGRHKPQPRSKAQIDSEDQEDDEVEAEIGAVASNSKAKTLRTGKKMQALFNPGSEDEDVDDYNEDLDLTLRSDRSQKTTRGVKRKAVVPEESDSDDGMNLRGFAKRAKRLKG